MTSSGSESTQGSLFRGSKYDAAETQRNPEVRVKLVVAMSGLEREPRDNRVVVRVVPVVNASVRRGQYPRAS